MIGRYVGTCIPPLSSDPPPDRIFTKIDDDSTNTHHIIPLGRKSCASRRGDAGQPTEHSRAGEFRPMLRNVQYNMSAAVTYSRKQNCTTLRPRPRSPKKSERK